MKNLILIIGNGFDLAHNMPTSYNQFSEYVIDELIIEQLLKLESKKFIKTDFIEIIKKSKNQIFDNTVDYRNLIRRIEEGKKEEVKNKLLENDKKLLIELLDNDFLKKLFQNKYDNWFDIEQAYFSELAYCYKFKSDKKTLNSLIEKLNLNFEQIKLELINYLKKVKLSHYNDLRHFDNEFYDGWDNFYIINFNYTDTIFKYFREGDQNPNVIVNFIHGDLKDRESEIVFGYGNDQHKLYSDIKESKIDSFLDYFKTYAYLRKDEYQKIFNEAIDRFDMYEIAILGHSLGESDKTLLKELFENSKCKKIHLFKRNDLNNMPIEQTKEFNKLIYAISRIISDDRVTRKVVLNQKESISFP